MSPVSRGRKRKKPQRGRATPRPRDVRPNPGLDGFDGLYAEMLRAFRPLARVTDPLEVEVFTSELLGAWWQRLPPGEDPERVFGLGAVEYAARAGTVYALGLLRALAVVGVTAEQREAASAAAAALAAGGVAEPPWAAEIGRVRVGECWRLADVYGDQASLLVVFGYGRRRHGLVALVDFNHLGGWVKDLFVTAEPARTLRELRKAALSEPLARLEQVDPAEARRLLEDGLAATDATWQPEVSQELRQYRALALARCRTMPAPDRSGESEREIGEREREAVVAEFLASAQAGGLPDGDAARYCARLLVDFGADYDDGRPLRVSPAKVEGFLYDWAPAKVMLDDESHDAMPAVVAAWVRWAGERTGLPAAALSELVEVACECGEHFAEVYEEAADASPLRLFLEGLDTSGGPAEVQDALDRRLFAMPFFGTRIGDEDFPDLDPGDPDERRLLIEGEHPEYHAALDDPTFEGEIDGVNPRLHWPSTRSSPTSCGTTTRPRRGEPPSGCATPAWIVMRSCTGSVESSPATFTAPSPERGRSMWRPTSRHSTRLAGHPPGDGPHAPAGHTQAGPPRPPPPGLGMRCTRSRSACVEHGHRSGGDCACPPPPHSATSMT
jgi:hypothetical protein